MSSEIVGIYQGDLILRSAIIAGLNDLRANPFLLDYVFASLPVDSLTAKEYGTEQVAKAKDWFLRHNITVAMNFNINEIKFPCISIALLASVEEEATLGDTHYEPLENADLDQPVLAGPMTPTSYDPVTGTIVFTTTALNNLILAPRMVLLTTTGAKYPVVECPDITTTIVIEAGHQLDLTDCKIVAAVPAYTVGVESVGYKETYSLGCHVDSEAVHLLYLHSILVFLLLRYRESLLEGRGYERTTLSSSDFRRSDVDLPEFFYDRYMQISGYVRQSWPKAFTRKPTSLFVQALPEDVVAVAPEKDLEDALELDALAVQIKTSNL